jgi:hypothetical protein
MNVARRAARSSLWSLASNLGQQALNFLFFVYTARLLDPSAFGLMALGMTLIDSCMVLCRGGLVEALIQKGVFDEDLEGEAVAEARASTFQDEPFEREQMIDRRGAVVGDVRWRERDARIGPSSGEAIAQQGVPAGGAAGRIGDDDGATHRGAATRLAY